MNINDPIPLLTAWILAERNHGAPDPQQAVLSTVSNDSHPHGRIVAIREINESGLLFFTQRGSRKVREIEANSNVSLTFWFGLFQREVMIDGVAALITEQENQTYWDTYPLSAQIRFYSYAPTSSRPIPSKQFLEEKRKALEFGCPHVSLPKSEDYLGFRVIPERLVFYSYRQDELSDVIEYYLKKNSWNRRLLSP